MTAASILIVEDERILAEELRLLLLELGHSVSGCVGSGEEAVDWVSRNKVSLILMDIKLEGIMNGIDAAKIINERFHVPVVYVTAYSDDSILKHAKVAEPFGYIVKPYRADEIKSTVEIALFKAEIDRKLKAAYEELEQKVKKRAAQLEEMNAALKVLMEYRENEKKEVIKTFSKNLNSLVIPHLDTIRMKCHSKELKILLDIVKTNIEEISQPFSKIISEELDLTPMESRVADLIRQGRTSKEIADLLGITSRGVTFHRGNIRRKMGIYNKRGSLRNTLTKIK